MIARHTHIISLRTWSHFTHNPGNPKLTNNKLFQYLAKFYSDNLNDCSIDKYKNDTGIYEAYHIQQNLSSLIVRQYQCGIDNKRDVIPYVAKLEFLIITREIMYTGKYDLLFYSA